MLICDSAYLPFASFVAWQVAVLSGPRDFDIVIVSHDELELPRFLTELGVKTRQVPREARVDQFRAGRLPPITYLRLFLPHIFAADYDRIFYLDSDLFFEGGDISRLLGIDMKGAAIGGVRDVGVFRNLHVHELEFQILDLPPTPYLNAGVLLIDTPQYRKVGVLDRALTLSAEHPEAVRSQDQSLLNLALNGDFAELHPGWNWMPNIGLACVARYQPVMFRHFITSRKPYLAEGARHDHRFRAAYRNFFQAYAPEWLELLPERTPPKSGFEVVPMFKRYVYQARYAARINEYLARFEDEWTVIRLGPEGKT